MVLASSKNTENYLFTKRSALQRLHDEAPYLARCSYNKTAARIRPREYALKYPYVTPNRQDFVSWLIFDLDHPNSIIWDEVGLPAPNFVVRDRNSGSSHLYYAISPVYTGINARQKPQAYMRAIYTAMREKLKGDEYYHGPIAKTPHHPWWQTWEIHSEEYDLGYLAEFLTLAVKPWWKKDSDDTETYPSFDDGSRHCVLFNELRHYAYSAVYEHRANGSYESFYSDLEQYANAHNNFAVRGFDEGDLPYSSIKSTVKSVAGWTWTKYTGNTRCAVGVMNLSPSLPLKERQALSAQRTHEERRKLTARRISAAVYRFTKRGERITYTAIAEWLSMSRQTIAKYSQHIQEATAQALSKVAQEEESHRRNAEKIANAARALFDRNEDVTFSAIGKALFLKPRLVARYSETIQKAVNAAAEIKAVKDVKYGAHQITGFSQPCTKPIKKPLGLALLNRFTEHKFEPEPPP